MNDRTPAGRAAATGRPRRPSARPSSGFTIVELMITIAIVAILLTVGIPSFRNVILNTRLTSLANEVVASVQIARSEAIKRNATVRLCASANGTTCATTGSWEQGWIVLTAAGVVLRHEALQTGWKVTEAGGLRELTFRPTGFGGSTASLRVCRSNPLGNAERLVAVGPTGGTSVQRTSTGSCS